MFSDHVINNNSWVSAGSTVNLTAYPDLSVELFENGLAANLKTTVDSPLDTWKYTIDRASGTLTLPKSDCYIKATSDPLSAGIFISAQAPNISGWVRNTDANEALTFADKISTAPNSALTIPQASRVTSEERYGVKQAKGSAYTKLEFDASRCSPVYKKGATTIMPDSNNMLIYFYVGRKVN